MNDTPWPDRDAVLGAWCPSCNAEPAAPCIGTDASPRKSSHSARVAMWQLMQRKLAEAQAPPYHRPGPGAPEAITDADKARGRAVIADIRAAMAAKRG